jgi:K+-sensing histidine kinase KdpD
MAIGDTSSAAHRREIAASIAHQARNPLALVVGYAELLKTREDPATRATAADAIVDAAGALRLVVDNLLAVFALELEAGVGEPIPVELDDAVADAIETVSARAPRHRITGATSEPWPTALVDPEQLHLLLVNLLTAGCACSSSDSSAVVGLRRANGLAEISIELPGCVLKPDELRALLRGPGLVNSISDVSASGLELYVAALIVQVNGGEIDVDDGRPVAVRFTLPLVGSEAEAA